MVSKTKKRLQHNHGFTKRILTNYSHQNINMGDSQHLYWVTNPIFTKQNKINKSRVILDKYHNPRYTQFTQYNKLLGTLCKYKKYNINLDFITEFYRHIYYDITGTFQINITDDGTHAAWAHPSQSSYKITKLVPLNSHGNTTILFLEDSAGHQKVLKVFNNLEVDPALQQEFLDLEINHIGESRAGATTGNYINYQDMDTFNIYNFNMIDYTIPEVRPNSRVYLS